VVLRLVESTRRREEQPAYFAAHSLKGSFATIGLSNLAQAVASVEEDCKERRWREADEHMAPVTKLFQEVKELIAARIGQQVRRPLKVDRQERKHYANYRNHAN
jgi:HPt (histidine-containing phosphotransfer) domain-containing protein